MDDAAHLQVEQICEDLCQGNEWFFKDVLSPGSAVDVEFTASEFKRGLGHLASCNRDAERWLVRICGGIWLSNAGENNQLAIQTLLSKRRRRNRNPG